MKWVHSLTESSFKVALFSFGKNKEKYLDVTLNKIPVFSLDLPNTLQQKNELSISKLRYLNAVKFIKKIISDFSPDIVHAHYASSYGFLGALSNFQPYVISVWGSDVLSFPYNSFIHRKILKFSLNHSSIVLATSEFLANQTKKFTQKEIHVTPFGVDVHKFNSIKIKRPFNGKDIVVGTIKSLEKTYGIDKLIEAFSIVKKRHQELPLKLFIVGSGSEENNLKELAKKMIDKNDCVFTGYINYDIIQDYHNMIDISVFLSNQESFGVSVLESMACCKPVIVSNTGGLREIVDNDQNGYFVSPNNPEEAANAIEQLIINPGLRIKLGTNGREKVKAFYNWNKSVDLMIKTYQHILKK
jgi:L-malate glycosyltransferase